jgi:hypothetical protein
MNFKIAGKKLNNICHCDCDKVHYHNWINYVLFFFIISSKNYFIENLPCLIWFLVVFYFDFRFLSILLPQITPKNKYRVRHKE